MKLSLRKLTAAALAVGALTFAAAGQARAGILLVLQNNGVQFGSVFSAGNTVTFTGANDGFTALNVTSTTNFPGSGVGSLITTVTASTATTGMIGQVVATAYVVNSNNPNDLATFTSPTGPNLFLNNQLSATGGTSGFLTLSSLGFGRGSVGSNVAVVTRANLPLSGTATDAGAFTATSGYSLFNQVVLDSLNNGANVVATGQSLVSPLLAPEPGTMAAALTGLLFVGGLGLRRRQK